jgi:alpha/beta superfamily hydrolase
MKTVEVSFLSGALSLEGILATPQGVGRFPAVIVCHPHALYGGSMDNNVVSVISDRLAQASFASLKFNLRGVGHSQGQFDQGTGEQRDVEAAVSFISAADHVDPGRIGLAGYSAGAGFGLPVGVGDARIRALAAISPPLSMFDFDLLKDCPKPKLLISGSSDDFTPVDHFLEFCHDLSEPKNYETVEGADHFWRGYESRVAAKVAAFFVKVLRPSAS